MRKIMKVFKTLINELFGTERECSGFGCKVCDWWPDKQYIWDGVMQLPFYSRQTIVLIEGDAVAPYPKQLSDLQMLLQNWQSMIKESDHRLSYKIQGTRKEEIYASWHDDFYPYTIVPAVLYSDSWEIVFYRKSGINYHFTVIWKNNTVQDLFFGAVGEKNPERN